MPRVNHKRPSVNFEHWLNRGIRAYEKDVGDWWLNQSKNPAHQRAYKSLAEDLAQALKGKTSPLIIDYACGDGSFLLRLRRRFPKARLVGVDGSKKLLQFTRGKFSTNSYEADFVPVSRAFSAIGPATRLVHSLLPNFGFERHRADAITFLFPNITFDHKQLAIYNGHGYSNPKEKRIAQALTRFREMDPEDEMGPEDKKELLDHLLSGRVLSSNIRHLVKDNGIVLRTEYANAPFQELTPLTRWRSLFAEAALEETIAEMKSNALFRWKNSKYRNSQVILDVFHQTGDPSDKVGGYYRSFYQPIKARKKGNQLK